MPRRTPRTRSGTSRNADLLLRTFLFAGLLVLLRILGTEITEEIVFVMVAAIFGADALALGVDRLARVIAQGKMNQDER